MSTNLDNLTASVAALEAAKIALTDEITRLTNELNASVAKVASVSADDAALPALQARVDAVRTDLQTAVTAAQETLAPLSVAS